MVRTLILMTTGTIAQKEVGGVMQSVLGPDEILDGIDWDGQVEAHHTGLRSGANFDLSALFEIKRLIDQHRDEFDGIILITGTDSMEEIAFGLDLLVEPGAPVVITGAMKPSDILGYDGKANLHQALMVASDSQSHGLGVLVVMNDSVHAARYVRKSDSQLIGAFTSHPGPMAQIRAGKVQYYYGQLPEISRYTTLQRPQEMPNVQIVPVTMGGVFAESILDESDGIILAGMATGSLPDSWIDLLSPTWTNRLPIVISTRCATGMNYDDHYYRGSLAKYEDKGFIVTDYAGLNSLQARIKLAFALSSGA